MIKVILVVVGAVISVVISGGFVFAVRDIIKRLSKDTKERRKMQRGERQL